MTNIGNRLKYFRDEIGMSQQEAASRLGISRPTYIAIEANKREVTLKELRLLSSVFGVDLGTLLFGDIKRSDSEDKLAKYKQLILNCIFYGADSHDQKITKTKLAKLIYLADFTAYYETHKPITGFKYLRLPQGPVTNAYFRLIDELFESGEITVEYRGTAQMIRLNEQPSANLLSDPELNTIKKVAEKWRNHPTKEIVDFTHQQIPWKVCQPGEPIPYELILRERAGNLY